ncbi:MAG: helix-turn-helix domain-containing protein [Actinobacteria bacterium]|nr:helix-turn-helix domain-containing protein [Actinomycetota bacterium]
MNDGRAPCQELGTFLRARREQLRPEDVGLRSSGRRRTPGLRREEVATLAGVSIDYLTRLEQGRDLRPSGAIVNALANALRLTDEDRVYLITLTVAGSAPELCPTAVPMVDHVAPNVQSIIDGLDPTPAFLTGPASHVLASNAAWRTLVDPLGMLTGDPPNLAAYVFTNPRSREVLAEWALVADEQVNQLRAASLRWGHDPVFSTLLERLLADPEFARRWSTHNVSERHRGLTMLRPMSAGSDGDDSLAARPSHCSMGTLHGGSEKVTNGVARRVHPVHTVQRRRRHAPFSSYVVKATAIGTTLVHPTEIDSTASSEPAALTGSSPMVTPTGGAAPRRCPRRRAGTPRAAARRA